MNYVKSFNLLGVDAKEIPCIELNGVPTKATEGAVGLLGMDITSNNHEVYKCVSVSGGEYIWENIRTPEEVISGLVAIKTGIDKTESGNYHTVTAIENSTIDVETEAETVYVCGENLANPEDIVSMSFAKVGGATYSSSAKCFIARCKPNTQYTIKKFENLGGLLRVASTEEKPVIGSICLTYANAATDVTELQVTTAPTANWLLVAVRTSSSADTLEDIMNVTMCVEGNEIPTEHKAFLGETKAVIDGKCEIVASDITNIFTESADDTLNVTYKTLIAENVNTLNEKMAEIENQEYWKKQRMRFADEPVMVAYSDGGQLGYINTLSAYMSAGIVGYKWAKGDIQPTADGKLIMCHDAGFTLNDSGKITSFDANNCTLIHDLTFEEAMALEYATPYAGKTLKVCSFEDYLQVCRDFNMKPYITIRKDYMDIVVPEMLRLIEYYDFTDRCIVNSFEKSSLQVVAEASNHRVMISNVIFYNEGKQITVEDIQKVLAISPNCTICPYNSSTATNIEIFENSSEALAFAKEQNIMVGTCATGATGSPTVYFKYGINLFQCYNTWIDTKVTLIPLYIKLTDGVATLDTKGIYGDKYTATITRSTQSDNVIVLSDIKRKGSERSYPDGVLPHLREFIPWSCSAVGSIVKSCEYLSTQAIAITLNDGATDGDIYVRFVYGF